MNAVLQIACCLSACICTVCLGLTFANAKSASRRRMIGTHDKDTNNSFKRTLRNGCRFLVPAAKALLTVHAIAIFTENATNLLRAKGLYTTPSALLSICLEILISSVLILTLITQSVAAGILGACLITLVCTWRINACIASRDKLMRDDIPGVIACIERCVTSGLSLNQTFYQVSKDQKGALGELFLRCHNDLQMGEPIKNVLLSLENATSIEELKFLAIALQIQHQAGGSLTNILAQTAKTTEDKLALQRQLQVQTAQAQMSMKIVTALPFFLLAALSAISPGFLNPFFSSVTGFALLSMALVMQLSGIVICKSILKKAS